MHQAASQTNPAPRSSSDSWRVLPYMNTVFKPIKDGIKSYVRGIAGSLENYVDGSGDADDVISAIFGPFAEVLKILMEINKAVMNIVKPFLDIVNNLLEDVQDFIMGLMSGALGGNKDAKDSSTKNVEDNTDNTDFLLNIIINMIGIDLDSKSKGDGSDEWTALEKSTVVVSVLNLWPAIVTAGLLAGEQKYISAIFCLVISSASLFCSLFFDINPIILSIISIMLGFIGLLVSLYAFAKNTLTDNIYVNGFLLLWSGIVCAFTSISSVTTLKECDFI